jgi:hypothetical protein
MTTQVRQGDVFVERVRSISSEARHHPVPLDAGRIILAYGEVTGHAHVVVATDREAALPPASLFEAPNGARFLLVDRPCALVHDEHGAIALAPGAYRVVRQREYSPEAIRSVAD